MARAIAAAFSDAVRLVLSWGFGFAIAVAIVFALFGPWLIHTMTASGDVQQTAQDYLWFVVASPLLAVFAFGYDGVFIGATWAREMRNLMIISLLFFLATWFALRGLGNTGLWIAFLVHYAARGGLQALRYPANLRVSFALDCGASRRLKERPMQLRFVGCGDAFGSGGRSNTCFHVTGERVNFLIDCGASSLPALKRQGVAQDDIDLILITHFHGDHFGGLPFLLLDAQFARRDAAADRSQARKESGCGSTCVMEALFENSSKTKQRFDLNIVTLSPETTVQLGRGERHAVSGGAWRIRRTVSGLPDRSEGRVIAYTADTEWTEALIPLGHDADLLIAEAYTFDRPVKNHLSLKALEARLADIKPKRLILTHMSDEMLGRARRSL